MIGAFLGGTFFNVLAYLYPALICYRDVKRRDARRIYLWTMYWVEIGILTALSPVADVLLSWLPLYREGKIAFAVALWWPDLRGAEKAWRSHLDPLLQRHLPDIDGAARMLGWLAGHVFGALAVAARRAAAAGLGGPVQATGALAEAASPFVEAVGEEASLHNAPASARPSIWALPAGASWAAGTVWGGAGAPAEPPDPSASLPAPLGSYPSSLAAALTGASSFLSGAAGSMSEAYSGAIAALAASGAVAAAAPGTGGPGPGPREATPSGPSYTGRPPSLSRVPDPSPFASVTPSGPSRSSPSRSGPSRSGPSGPGPAPSGPSRSNPSGASLYPTVEPYSGRDEAAVVQRGPRVDSASEPPPHPWPPSFETASSPPSRDAGGALPDELIGAPSGSWRHGVSSLGGVRSWIRARGPGDDGRDAGARDPPAARGRTDPLAHDVEFTDISDFLIMDD